MTAERATGGGSHAETALLALLLEVASTPTAGNVDRKRDLPDLRFGQFLAGAAGATPGLRAAAGDGPLGEAFETAVAGMVERAGTNTQFGALLLLVPLVRAAASGSLTPEGVDRVTAATTVADAAAFYRALDRAPVAVGDPPEGAEPLDARRGSDAVPAVEARDLSLRDVLALGDDRDAVAAEWTAGFERTFRVADRLRDGTAPLTDRAAAAHLAELAAEPDSLVARRHGPAVARAVSAEAADLLARDAGSERIRAFATALASRDINPGTTADIVAAGLYVALERGASV